MAKAKPRKKPAARKPARKAKPARRAAAPKRKKTAAPARKAAAKRPAPGRKPPSGLPMPGILLDATEVADVVTVPARKTLSIEGTGGPHGEGFGRAIGALYGVAYTLKFSRKPSGRDFKIGPLEGRWWAEGAASRVAPPPIDQWCWRLRMGVPDDVDDHELADVIQAATMKKGGKLEGSVDARKVTLERIPAQVMGRVLHVGPFADEPRSFKKIEGALAVARRKAAFPHLELYLSDPRRTKPAKLRTVLLLETIG